MSSFSGITFVLFCFVSLLSLNEAAAFRSIVLRYAYAPTATRSYLTTVCALFCFCFFGDVAFSEFFLYHYRLRFVWRVRRTFSPSGSCFFSPRTLFYISWCEDSIEQSIRYAWSSNKAEYSWLFSLSLSRPWINRVRLPILLAVS